MKKTTLLVSSLSVWLGGLVGQAQFSWPYPPSPVGDEHFALIAGVHVLSSTETEIKVYAKNLTTETLLVGDSVFWLKIGTGTGAPVPSFVSASLDALTGTPYQGVGVPNYTIVDPPDNTSLYWTVEMGADPASFVADNPLTPEDEGMSLLLTAIVHAESMIGTWPLTWESYGMVNLSGGDAFTYIAQNGVLVPEPAQFGLASVLVLGALAGFRRSRA